MPAMSKTLKSLESNADPNTDSGGARRVSCYEQCREERIKENLQRMQSLGIFGLSLKLKSETRTPKKPSSSPNSDRKSTRDTPLLQPSGPTRRSSRLQNVTPVSYSEAVEAKRGKTLEDKIIQLEEGARPEIYTEEHEKLLGNTERSWTCFVDGYGKDGKRIYDPVNGKSCHQCRQKTLGHRTQCSQCNMVQGQFCGDCLYMRYGEHILEALENPDWICPVCRGICNCSLCRNQKGWLPTGAIYRRISKLGYKSVAHYLVQTKRSTNSEKEPDSDPNQSSAKRSLSFQEVEALCQEHPHPKTEDDLPEIRKLQVDATTDDKSLQEKRKYKMGIPSNDERSDGQKDGDFLQNEENSMTGEKLNFFFPSDDKQVSTVEAEVQGDINPTEQNPVKKESNGGFESCSENTWKRKVSLEPNPGSVAGRLKQRRRNQIGLAIEKSV